MGDVLDTDPDKMLCYCLGVRYGTVVECVREDRLVSVAQVTRACKAGGGCRSCHPEIQEVIDAVRKSRRRRGPLRRLFAWLGRA